MPFRVLTDWRAEAGCHVYISHHSAVSRSEWQARGVGRRGAQGIECYIDYEGNTCRQA